MAVRDAFAQPYYQHTPGLQAPPTVATAFPIPAGQPALKFNSWVEQISVDNTTAAALTFTVTDNAGNGLITAQSIAANSTVVFTWPRPVKLVGGGKWNGSAAGLIVELKAYYV